jgi:hypothetical protein
MHAALLAGLGPEKMLPLGAIVVSLQNFWQLSKIGSKLVVAAEV